MQLYIANCTRQPHDFVFRVPEQTQTTRQIVPAGSQVPILRNDANPGVVDAIVKQHERYGLVPVTDIDRTKPFIGLCYSIDKPISVDRLMHAHEHNKGVVTRSGHEQRQAVSAAIQNKFEKEFVPELGLMRNLEVEVIEDKPEQRDFIKETINVNRERDGVSTDKPKRAPRRRS